MFYCYPDAARQIASVGVMTCLIAGSEDVQHLLPFKHLLYKIGHDVRHGKLNVSPQDVAVALGALLANTGAIERTHNGIRRLVLLPGTLGEVLRRQFLKAVGRVTRRTTALRALRSRKLHGVFEHHAGREQGHGGWLVLLPCKS